MEFRKENHGHRASCLQKDSITKRLKLIRICFAFTMQGWTEALNGPTFSDIRRIIDKDLDTSSWLFTITSLGVLVGSGVASLLLRLKQRNAVFAVTILCYATGVALVPWCSNFYLMLTVKFFVGVFVSILSTGYITEMASTWKEKAGFHLQILNFCFSLGGMVSPLVARPFLSSEIKDKVSSVSCNSSVDYLDSLRMSEENTGYNNISNLESIINGLDVSDNDSTVICGKQFTETNVMYAYLITAILLAMAAMMFVAAFVVDVTSKKQTKHTTDKVQNNSKSEEIPFYLKLIFISLMLFLLFLHVGCEATFSGYLSSFTSLQLNWSQSKSAIATSVFWIAFGLARFAGIWLAKILRTITFMFTFPSLLIISYGLLLLATLIQNDIFVIICVGMVGASMSVIFASIFTWTSENITVVTDQISALFIASCSVGIMAFPLLFGYTMDLYSPLWFNYLLIGIGVIWLIVFTVTFILSKHLLTARTIEIEIAEKQPFQTVE